MQGLAYFCVSLVCFSFEDAGVAAFLLRVCVLSTFRHTLLRLATRVFKEHLPWLCSISPASSVSYTNFTLRNLSLTLYPHPLPPQSPSGQVLFGYYCDIRPFTGVMVFSAILTSILAYGVWGFAHELSTVFVFIVFFASIVSSRLPGLVTGMISPH